MCRIDLRGPLLKRYRAVRAEREADPARSKTLDQIGRLEARRIAVNATRESEAHGPAT